MAVNKKTTKKVKTSPAKPSAKMSRTVSKAAAGSKEASYAANRGVIDNIWGVILIALGVFLFAAVKFNAAGKFGNLLGDILKGLFGHIGLILPLYLIFFGIMLIANQTVHISFYSAFLGLLILLMMCLINSGRYIDSDREAVYAFKSYYETGISLSSGGFIGMNMAIFIVKYMGKVGLYGLALAVTAVSLLLIINTPISRAIENFRDKRKAKKAEKDLIRQDEIARYEEEKRIKENLEKERLNKKQETLDNQRKLDMIKMREDMREAPDSIGEKREEKIKNKDPEAIEAFMKVASDDPDTGAGIGDKENDQVEVPGPTGVDPGESLIDFEKDGDKDFGSDPEAYEEKQAGISYGIEEQRVEREGFGLGDASMDPTDVPFQEPFSGVQGGSGIYEEPSSLGPENDKNSSGIGDKLYPAIPKKEKEETLGASDFSKIKKSKTYRKPPISLLKRGRNSVNQGAIRNEITSRAEILEQTLDSFNVGAKVVKVTRGPAITRYEIQPDIGVKVSKIVNLADDIALNMRARSIRIEAPIPGKAAVGIEIENEKINLVSLREIIESKEFTDSKSKISFALGKDVAGKAIIGDLKDMPHLLVAGSTGSGKSVCINSIITSILYKADPDEVKLVLIDPKVVELGNYNGIPHLLIPVVTDPKKASAALNWAVGEMTDRYKKFADIGARDLKGYNMKMKKEGKDDDVLPQVVIIIDELADLMMAAPSQVEEAICRLAQLARAAGMHLIVATQRPSVDIITGLIKANITSRIAFAVSSQFDSRTIIDMGGAEKLVGKGDMLYKPMGMKKPIRVQGCFISDEELRNVVSFVKEQVEDVEYSGEVMDSIDRVDKDEDIGDRDGEDDLWEEAVDCVIDAGKASASMLQRRFRIGYNRAARLIDTMEERGYIGPADGSRPREVLVTKDELRDITGKVDE